MDKIYAFFVALAFIFVGCGDEVTSTSSVDNKEVEKVLTRADIKEDFIKDDRDGETYRTVRIGEQWWMAENLRYAADSSFCYSGEDYFCENYGRLYRWPSAMNLDTVYYHEGAIYDDVVDSLHQGVCPKGWHIPTKMEWETLINFIRAHNGDEGDGTSIRSPQMWGEYGEGASKVTHSDRFGFSVLPAGQRVNSAAGRNGNAYEDFTGDAYFWTATEVNYFRNDVAKAYYVWIVGEWNENAVKLRNDKSKGDAFSIRCVKN